ncbi:MAG: hypothetical protein HY852_16905 [Bradyrhizobium sp.]|uniref:hypothetical protein n=1 Tax=Bradyrhizobium sp. TaxID=376 RepID=UPI0025C5D2A8|nr:hypothetical protein [Bradyrhizobium sp.]MBI5263492.1 hypothetical protein [Bradyrhizobium sp.]
MSDTLSVNHPFQMIGFTALQRVLRAACCSFALSAHEERSDKQEGGGDTIHHKDGPHCRGAMALQTVSE